MDFFEQQDQARKRSFWLVVLFVVAVIIITALSCGVVYLASLYFVAQNATGPTTGAAGTGMLPGGVHPLVLVATAIVTVLLILGASGYRVLSLRGGGENVALSLGGRPIDADTADADERKLLNVVEEMAIASGVPVPPVFVMEQDSINAFAAGYHPDDAVVGVTRGCIQKLSRDELQGVIAHEFSHIFNGDMRLNIRLIGLVFGLLVIALVGQTVMRGMFWSSAAGGHRRRSSRDSNGGGAVIVILLAGLALMIIGYAGVFFARWIKSAISRQREYLADSAAVQFTRYPDGIAGALKKIGAYSGHGKIDHAEAEEMSHMFFANALSSGLGSLFATHPPLDQRIKAIDPSWDGQFPDINDQALSARDTSQAKPRKTTLGDALPGVQIPGVNIPGMEQGGLAAGLAAGAGRLQRATSSIGDPQPAHMERAAALLQEVPEGLRHAAETPFGCRAVVYAMLLDGDADVRAKQMKHLQEHADAPVVDLTEHLHKQVAELETRLRLPLLSLTSVGIHELSESQAKAFASNIQALAAADDRIDLFEWMLRRWARKTLARAMGRARPKRVLHYKVKSLAKPIGTVISALAYVGADTPEAAAEAHRAALATMELPDLALADKSQIGFKQIDEALEALREAAPKVKKQVITACAACVEHDHEVTDREAELLRGVADALDLPMPPVLD